MNQGTTPTTKPTQAIKGSLISMHHFRRTVLATARDIQTPRLKDQRSVHCWNDIIGSIFRYSLYQLENSVFLNPENKKILYVLKRL